jgi:hypothetical protein
VGELVFSPHQLEKSNDKSTTRINHYVKVNVIHSVILRVVDNLSSVHSYLRMYESEALCNDHRASNVNQLACGADLLTYLIVIGCVISTSCPVHPFAIVESGTSGAAEVHVIYRVPITHCAGQNIDTHARGQGH